MLARHRQNDELPMSPISMPKRWCGWQRLERDAQKMPSSGCATHPHDRRGTRGSVLKSNRTDNESAKMATDKGVFAGLCRCSRGRWQAPDHCGSSSARHLAQNRRCWCRWSKPVLPLLGKDSTLTADAGYHSEQNLKELAALQVNALIADTDA